MKLTSNGKKNMKYELRDTFNKKLISTHRSLLAARKAELRFGRAVKRANGKSSYIPTAIRRDGNLPLTESEADDVMKISLAVEALGISNVTASDCK